MLTRSPILLALLLAAARPPADVLRSARSGPWSDPATWEGGAVPGLGAKVLVRPGHAVLYDLVSEQAIRSVHVGGTLRFATDRNTRLDVGLLKIQPGEECVEDGFACEAHLAPPDPGQERPALLVGTPEQPVRISPMGIPAKPAGARSSAWSISTAWTRRPARRSSPARAAWNSTERP